VARALATGKSKTLGVVSFDTTLYGPASTLFGIHRAAHEEGYFISTASLRTLDRESFLGAVERLRGQGVEGILVIAPQTDAAHSVLHLPDDLAVVAVEAGPDRGIPVVAVDQVAGAVEATRHLLELGHRTVWHVAGPEDWLEAQQRITGWRQVLQAAAAELPPIQIGDWSPRSGYEIGQRLALDRDVTAVFVANDQMALGLLRDFALDGQRAVVASSSRSTGSPEAISLRASSRSSERLTLSAPASLPPLTYQIVNSPSSIDPRTISSSHS